MSKFNIGDIVGRKSYGADISFVISNVIESGSRGEEYVLKGLEYRLEATAQAKDLMLLNPGREAFNKKMHLSMLCSRAARQKLLAEAYRIGRRLGRPGRILHIDGSRQFLNDSMWYYRSVGLRAAGVYVDTPQQPQAVRGLLEQHRPDIVIITGHDGIAKDATDLYSFDSYKKSRYYANAVKEARVYEPDPDKLCIFAGACQSYYEAIMSSGANFASSPARVLVHSFDPVMVAQRVATTDSKRFVTPAAAVAGTVSGSKGIGGINTRGRMTLA